MSFLYGNPGFSLGFERNDPNLKRLKAPIASKHDYNLAGVKESKYTFAIAVCGGVTEKCFELVPLPSFIPKNASVPHLEVSLGSLT